MRELIQEGRADPATVAAWDEIAETVKTCLLDDGPELADLTHEEREQAARELVAEFIEQYFPTKATIH